MYEALKRYVGEAVWCSPGEDNQIILKPQRITRLVGDRVSVGVMSRRIDLPDSTNYYHVFFIGHASPKLLGLLPRVPEWGNSYWISLKDAVNQLNLFVDLYTDDGLHIPLDRAYYRYTQDKALVICIKDKACSAVNMKTAVPYIRFYTNLYYGTVSGDTLTVNTYVRGSQIYSVTDILALQSIVNQWKTSYKGVFIYINGRFAESVSPFTVSVGDYVEVVLDTSVKRVVDLPVNALKTFNSERDQCYKYLLHCPNPGDQITDYLDDCDFYVYRKSDPKLIGQYIHRNQKKSIRMVTHRDYSLAVDVFEVISSSLLTFLDDASVSYDDLVIRIFIRNGGLEQTLKYDHHRQFELYKLTDDQILNAMLGVDATVPYWTASALENSGYVKLYDKAYADITNDDIEEALGYNAMTRILADTPLRATDHATDAEIFTLPLGVRNNSTIYEYDADGTLLGFYYHSYGSSYIAKNISCELIEAIVGKGTDTPEVYYGVDKIQLPTDYGYRVYMAYFNSNMQVSDWFDITNSDKYTVTDGVLNWASTDTGYQLMVRSDRTFLAYSFEMTPIAGTIYFSLEENSGGVYRELPVPLGDLDIWLNGKRLTTGLDVNGDFPKYYIVNKEYLAQPAGSTSQKITIRMSGFAKTVNEKLVIDDQTDTGFIVHGVLSNNDRYDIRDDRVFSLYVKGQLKMREDMIFSEQHAGISVTNALNGQPYALVERLIPLTGLTGTNSAILRDKSKVIDTVVSNYMTDMLPQPERNAASAIQSRHILVSPFFSHLINDLASGQFDMSSIKKTLTDSDVLSICKEYEFLLEFDPLNETLGLDYRFLLIHPHQLMTTIVLDLYSYTFMARVIKLYGKNLISLSGHLIINTEGTINV